MLGLAAVRIMAGADAGTLTEQLAGPEGPASCQVCQRGIGEMPPGMIMKPYPATVRSDLPHAMPLQPTKHPSGEAHGVCRHSRNWQNIPAASGVLTASLVKDVGSLH